MTPSAAIRFEPAWRWFAHGELSDLENAITQEGYTLAVVDTFGRLAGEAKQEMR